MILSMLSKISLKRLAIISLAVLAFGLSACDSNTNPLTDKSKHKYHPQNRNELVALLNNESIKLDTIDTSKITDMSFLFAGVTDDVCDYLQEDDKKLEPYIERCKNSTKYREDFSGIETWDTSNVTDMSGMFMFFYAENFNQSLNSWDVSKVTDMNSMFYGSENFNQPLDNWDVSNVTDMSKMFYAASNFNQSLDNWNVSNVANMQGMFDGSPLASNPPKWASE